MPLVVRFDVSGMNTQKYEQILAKLTAAGQGAPKGRLYHVSYGDPNDLQVIDVYENEADLQAFGATLIPILMEMGVQATPNPMPGYKIIEG